MSKNEQKTRKKREKNEKLNSIVMPRSGPGMLRDGPRLARHCVG